MDAFSTSIDKAKGLAILLVMLGHINSPLGGVIYSFHVPMFFFLAGLFIKIGYSWKEYLKKGLDRLIIPFLIFGAIGFLATLVKNVLLHRPIEPFSESLAGLLYWADSMHMHHYGFTLWFLPALFWGRTLVFFGVKYIYWHPAILMAVATVIAWLAAHYVTLPFGLDKALVALPWILMGYLFYQNRERWLTVNWPYIFFLTLFIALFVYLGGLPHLDLATKNMGNPLQSIPYSVAVIFLLTWSLYKFNHYTGYWTKRYLNVLIQFGQNSMLVLVLHVYTNNAADILVNHLLGAGYWFVTFAMSVALVYLAILVKKRYSDSLIFRYL